MIDPKTGLPELPEGYFWRVTGLDIIKKHEIHIMQRRRFLPPKSRGHWYIEPRQMSPEHIAYCAALTLRLSDQWLEHTAVRTPQLLKSRAGLLGDYPPKSLSTSSSGGTAT